MINKSACSRGKRGSYLEVIWRDRKTNIWIHEVGECQSMTHTLTQRVEIWKMQRARTSHIFTVDTRVGNTYIGKLRRREIMLDTARFANFVRSCTSNTSSILLGRFYKTDKLVKRENITFERHITTPKDINRLICLTWREEKTVQTNTKHLQFSLFSSV